MISYSLFNELRESDRVYSLKQVLVQDVSVFGKYLSYSIDTFPKITNNRNSEKVDSTFDFLFKSYKKINSKSLLFSHLTNRFTQITQTEKVCKETSTISVLNFIISDTKFSGNCI